MRPGARACALLGTMLIGLGLWAARVSFGAPVVMYDEGLLLTHAWLMLTGLLPHRDFYTNYPPGIYLAIDALWRVFGISPWTLRALGLAIHVAIGLLAGRLAGRCVGRPFLPLVCGLVLCWLAFLDLVSFAWLAALAVALLTFEVWLVAESRRHPAFDLAAGLAFFAISCFRHDLFVYLAAALVIFALARRFRTPGRRALAFGLGAAVPLALVWLPLAARADFMPMLRDLVLDQIFYVNPARRLPPPPLFALRGMLPAFLADPYPGAVALTLAGPAVAALLFWKRRALELTDARPLILLAALSLAVLPHLLQRCDIYHAALSVTPGATLFGLLAEAAAGGSRRVASSLMRAALVALVAFVPLLPWLAARRWDAPALVSGPPPYRGLPAPDDRLAALAFVARTTRPGEPIFVGQRQHRRVSANEVDFYFFAERPGATRYLQFDPNMQTRAEVQRGMIAELEQRRPRLAVLSPARLLDEPNESRREGAGDLDAYLRTEYTPVAQIGRYSLLWRNDAPGRP